MLDKFLKVGCLASLLVLVLWVAPTFAADAPTLQSVSDAVKSAQVSADTAYMLICSALVLFMTPGLAFFYGGFVAKRNILNTLMMSFLLMGIVGVSWVLWGYSLAFDPGNPFIGSFDWFGLNKVGLETSGYLKAMPELSDPAAAALDSYAATVPHQVFMIYQAMFAIITPALISGAIVERTSFTAYSLFVLLWSTFIYSPMAHMVWAKGGFFGLAGGLGALDFAGGTVVHIASGVSALTAAMFLGPRKSYPDRVAAPHNVPFILLGAGMLWFGWFGFNAGSALSVAPGMSGTVATSVATTAFVATNTSAAAALVMWLILEKVLRGKPTAVGAASGAVAGLVGITPAAGFVTPTAAILIGLITATCCFFAISLKHKLGIDDSLDTFPVHGVGGTVGAVLTGIFATTAVNAAGKNGLLYGNPGQVGIQLAAIGVTYVVAIVGTLAILWLLKLIGISLRPTENQEQQGMDINEHGEEGYGEEFGGGVVAINEQPAE
ncbi:MAG: ammonium transporter [Pseudanabaenaceae cyanobacterium]